MGVKGILIKAAELGYITQVTCKMPECFCPEELGGARYFEPVTRPGTDWMPTHEHFPLSKREGGHRTVDNSVLAHRLCNRIDYSISVGRSYASDLERVRKAREAAAGSLRTDPTPDELFAAFDGRIYRPVGEWAVGPSLGWGRSGDSVSSLRIQHVLGAAKESVSVEVSKHEGRPAQLVALQHLTFEFGLVRRPRFPIVIERGKVRIPVEGTSRMFTTYTAGSAAVATATIGDLDLMVRDARRNDY